MMSFHTMEKTEAKEDIVAKYRHGSKDSVDIDVVFVMENVPSHKDCLQFVQDEQEDRNIITLKDGVVDFCFKGNSCISYR
jgi:hypothetical protein